MNKATRKKLDDIIQLLKNGVSEKEIIKIKFGRNNKRMKDWLSKIYQELTSEEIKLLSFENIRAKELVPEVDKNEIATDINLKAIQLLEEHEKRLKALESKLEPRMNEEVEVLIINDDILRLKSVVRSVRINPELINDFNSIADKHLNYSKTNLLNQAIYEFIKKYK